KRPIHRSRHATPPRCAGASLAGCWWLALQNRMFGVLGLAPEPASGADDGTVAYVGAFPCTTRGPDVWRRPWTVTMSGSLVLPMTLCLACAVRRRDGCAGSG